MGLRDDDDARCIRFGIGGWTNLVAKGCIEKLSVRDVLEGMNDSSLLESSLKYGVEKLGVDLQLGVRNAAACHIPLSRPNLLECWTGAATLSKTIPSRN